MPFEIQEKKLSWICKSQWSWIQMAVWSAASQYGDQNQQLRLGFLPQGPPGFLPCLSLWVCLRLRPILLHPGPVEEQESRSELQLKKLPAQRLAVQYEGQKQDWAKCILGLVSRTFLTDAEPINKECIHPAWKERLENTVAFSWLKNWEFNFSPRW